MKRGGGFGSRLFLFGEVPMSFPAWFYGPDGQAAIFHSAESIPEGWTDAPGKAPAHPLDRDRNGAKGGSLPRSRKRVKN
jgi:hypothetical protein